MCVCVWERERNIEKPERIESFLIGPQFYARHAPLVFNPVLDANLNEPLYVEERGIPITRGKCRIVLESVERVGVVDRYADSPTWR